MQESQRSEDRIVPRSLASQLPAGVIAIDILQTRVAELDHENQQLREENERLRKAEARYRQIVENAPISIQSISVAGDPIEQNSAAEKFLGWTIAQAQAAGFNALSDPALNENGTLASIQSAIAGETVIEPPISYNPSEQTIGDGQWRWAQGHYYPIYNEAGEVQEIVEIALDLTEMYQVQQALSQNRTTLLNTIAQVANLLLRSPDYTTVLPDVVQLLGKAVGSDRCGIGQNILHPVLGKPAVRIPPEWEWCKARVLHSEEFSLHLDRLFLREEAPYIDKNLSQGEVTNCFVADLPEPDRSLLAAQGNTAELFVPISVNHQYWGFIAFDNCGEPRLYDEAEIAILRIAADSIAAAIERQIQAQALLQAEQARSAELEKVNDALKRSLDSLATEPSLDKFLGQVLGAIAEQFNSPMAEYWYHPEDTAYVGMMSWQGQIHDREEISKLYPTHPGVTGFKVPPAMIHGETLQHRKQYLITEDWLSDPFTQHIKWMPEHGLYKQINVPMVLGDDCIGALVVRMSREQQITTQQIELAQALAHQATLAAQLMRLAEEAKQAAIAREQEKAAQQRAAELAKANSALQQMLCVLAKSPQLDAFLEQVLRTISEQVESNYTVLWVFNTEAKQAHVSRVYYNAQVTIPHLDFLPLNVQTQPLPSSESLWMRKVLEGQPCLLEDAPNNPLISPQGRQHVLERGVKTVLCLPLLLDDAVLGSFNITFATPRIMRPEELETLQALTHQATLAFQLTRLAEAAKQAAIAREQEKAAQERVAELAKANEALKHTLDLLATEPTIDAFLGQVLAILTDQLQAASSSLWLFDWDAQTSNLHLVCQQGQIIPGAQAGYPSTVLPFADFRDDPGWRTVVNERRPWVHEAATSSSFTEAIRSQLMAQGVKTILSIPLVLGDRAIGSFNMRLTAALPSVLPEQIELAQALIHQATLAIRMTRLSEQVKETAVLEERNRMAREIHDTLAQSFTGVVIQLEAAKRIVTTEPDATRTHLTRASSLAREGLAEARRSVQALRPQALETQDLPTALVQLVKQVTANTTIVADAIVEGSPYPLLPEVELNLLRISQEALTNTLKHAQAKTVYLRLRFELNAVQLCIVDDGQGFDPDRARTRPGFGLIGIQERADRLNAQLTVTSQIGIGTTIALSVPVSRL